MPPSSLGAAEVLKAIFLSDCRFNCAVLKGHRVNIPELILLE